MAPAGTVAVVEIVTLPLTSEGLGLVVMANVEVTAVTVVEARRVVFAVAVTV
jgi:hypothetical protein